MKDDYISIKEVANGYFVNINEYASAGRKALSFVATSKADLLAQLEKHLTHETEKQCQAAGR